MVQNRLRCIDASNGKWEKFAPNQFRRRLLYAGRSALGPKRAPSAGGRNVAYRSRCSLVFVVGAADRIIGTTGVGQGHRQDRVHRPAHWWKLRARNRRTQLGGSRGAAAQRRSEAALSVR